ncbi:aldolase catalytic domain-containing protein [Celerinatantimonas yamalensis]|uniref:Aldolase catalytic domain-containing protein n=1 Tax=Celerinatantimonas yamalensis TaxID=559956 RepID=A0ABW9G5I7_9GAMM
MVKNKVIHLDCTLRDGGYYNDWDFSIALVSEYLQAMAALQVDFVEIGLRSLKNEGFKGGFAFSTDSFLSSLPIPTELSDKIAVMINGAELINNQKETLSKLFGPKLQSPVSLVRIACHVHEFEACLSAANWLKEQGYLVGFNLMQVADRSYEQMTSLARKANNYPIDVLYFADSMGSLSPKDMSSIIQAFQAGWKGALGIHTHDNMGQAVANTLQAIRNGVIWVDSTVTGMGRGPGNAQTEYLAMALAPYRPFNGNPTKLFELIHKRFKSLQVQYGWGTNPYYYMAGQFGIHPTYIQEMLQDSRYSDEDIIAVIEYLKVEGGKKFSLNTLEAARHFYSGEPRGTWSPKTIIKGRDVLIVGTGPGVVKYCSAIEAFIEQYHPYVIALNTQKALREELINARAACHPVRLLADCQEHLTLQQPLITPASMLPEEIKQALSVKKLLDFGVSINNTGFEFFDNYAQLPTSLVMAYSLAIATCGQAKRIFLVGFDGYPDGDPRNNESESIVKEYLSSNCPLELISLTPTRYHMKKQSLFGMQK